MARVMSARQRAALKKAQAASAAKRRGTGKKRPPAKRRAASKPGIAKRAKTRYQRDHTGPGAKYRRQRDKFKNQGKYRLKNGKNGTKKSKFRRTRNVSRKVMATKTVVGQGPIGIATYGVSYARHRSSGGNMASNHRGKGRVKKTAKKRKR